MGGEIVQVRTAASDLQIVYLLLIKNSNSIGLLILFLQFPAFNSLQ